MSTPSHAGPVERFLELEILKGPLNELDTSRLLAGYNRLTHSTVSMAAFRWCLEQNPYGPGLHAILRNDEGLLVGHICLFHLPVVMDGREVNAAKAEYLFLLEEYRGWRVRSFEHEKIPPALLLLKAFYRAAHAEGIDPVLVSAVPGVDTLHLMAGARAVTFPLHECLFILRPWAASCDTPNLTFLRRLAVLATGILQTGLAVLLRQSLRFGPDPLNECSLGRPPLETYPDNRAVFPQSEKFMAWRYPEPAYQRLATRRDSHRQIVLLRGKGKNYLRVCTTNLDARALPATRCVASLLRRAGREGALGLRWSIYRDGSLPEATVGRLRRLGFLCVPRSRNILMHVADERYLDARAWQMEDSLVAFDI